MSPNNYPTGNIGLKKNNVNIIVSKKFAQFSVKPTYQMAGDNNEANRIHGNSDF